MHFLRTRIFRRIDIGQLFYLPVLAMALWFGSGLLGSFAIGGHSYYDGLVAAARAYYPDAADIRVTQQGEMYPLTTLVVELPPDSYPEVPKLPAYCCPQINSCYPDGVVQFEPREWSFAFELVGKKQVPQAQLRMYSSSAGADEVSVSTNALCDRRIIH
ncbi:MAG: hypothetical protein LBR29_10045 [Methylobacteriaceae bacterium]|jgi:hypothetical protein|nr:hypothetical protein [Methylobacteriaceae bacterium]